MNLPRETQEKLDAYELLVREAAAHQNLVSAGSLDQFALRHIEDSAQLLQLATGPGQWLDLGSGAGLPGIVLGILGADVLLVESRRLRSDFLAHAISALRLEETVSLYAGRLETMPVRQFDRITARAFAPLPKLLTVAHRFSTLNTVWILPKGRSATSELDAVRGTWQGDFRVIPSRSDPDAAIIVASAVRPKEPR